MLRLTAIFAMLAAIAAVVVVVALHLSIFAIADAFLAFMAAFCFMQAQFIAPSKVSAKRLLNLISLFFLLLAAALLVAIIAYTAIDSRMQ